MKTGTKLKRERKWIRTGLLALGLMMAFATVGRAAGTLTPKGSPDAAIQIRSHHADVVINNGFAKTAVTQTFYNPNNRDLEGIYSFPLPRTASLSEMTIWTGETEMNGEVLTKKEADKIYDEEKQKGNDAGKAEKNNTQTFDFYVAKIPAQGETKVRFVYYQPLKIDTGVGKYVYPLEPGGTDEQAKAFWTQNKKVDGQFSVHVELKSAHPVIDVRVPSYSATSKVTEKGEGHYQVDMAASNAAIDKDFILYYRLANDMPGRVEMIPYRPDPTKPGTFMMVVTPGIDLKPLTNGVDYIYVLDKSGSMNGGKIRTLAKGVSKAIGGMRPHDRFRVITFNTSAHELTSGWVSATPENIKRELRRVARINANGGTDIHSSLRLALSKLDDDRATSIVLVTDGVTNTGVIAPKAFMTLLSKYDVRVFGFVMGNSANWPLMDMIGKVSGGFSTGVSNDDDIVGQIMLAKSKVCFESLHDADIKITGVKTFETSDTFVKKLYRGQQLVLFGRYESAGKAKVSLHARLTGEDKVYTTAFEFPETDTDNPELERLWALNRIEQSKELCTAGMLPPKELEDIERDYGVKYQLVTDETSMVVVSDDVFAQRGLQRRNQQRVAIERQAQTRRAAQPTRNYNVSQGQNTFPSRLPRIGTGGGGGAIDPLTAIGIVIMGLAGASSIRNRNKE